MQPAQNVIVEIQYQSTSPKPGAGSQQRSAYVGWTGMPSKRKIAPVVSRDGISGVRGASRDQDIAVIELDATFGRVLGLADGQKVARLHVWICEWYTDVYYRLACFYMSTRRSLIRSTLSR